MTGSATVADVAWVPVSVVLGFVGLAVLGYCSFRVYLAVRGLGRELERTRARLAPKQSALRDELRDLEDARTPYGSGDGVRSS